MVYTFFKVEVDQLNIAIVASEKQKLNLLEDNKDAQSIIDDLKKKSSEMVDALKEKKVSSLNDMLKLNKIDFDLQIKF